MNTQPSAPKHNDEDALSLLEAGSLDYQRPMDSQMESLILACQEAREKMKHQTVSSPMDYSYLLDAISR
jgi:hypothetical protein